MRTRPTLLAARLTVIALALTLGVPATGAVAQESEEAAVRFSGEWMLVGCAIFTDVRIDPEDPTAPWHLEFESASLLFGDLVGVDHSRTTATVDPQTGESEGYIWETFIGTYAPDGSTGIMTREGPFKADPGELRSNQRITGGAGDFEGARGYLHVVGSQPVPGVACVGLGGTYDGVWVRG